MIDDAGDFHHGNPSLFEEDADNVVVTKLSQGYGVSFISVKNKAAIYYFMWITLLVCTRITILELMISFAFTLILGSPKHQSIVLFNGK